MAIEAIKGAGMVYQGSTSTAQIKEQAQGRTEVSLSLIHISEPTRPY